MSKKFIAFVLSISLLLAFGVTANAAQLEAEATDVSLPSRDELFALGHEVFPEYSDILDCNVPISAQNIQPADENEIVCVETRKISDNEYLTYQQYSTGAASLVFNKSWTNQSTTTSGNSKTYTGNLVVGCNWSQETFVITGFQYKIVTGGYDSIVSTGSLTGSTCTYNRHSYNSTETSSSNAYLKYNVVFQPSSTLWDLGFSPVSGLVTLSVGGDSFSYTVD